LEVKELLAFFIPRPAQAELERGTLSCIKALDSLAAEG